MEPAVCGVEELMEELRPLFADISNIPHPLDFHDGIRTEAGIHNQIARSIERDSGITYTRVFTYIPYQGEPISLCTYCVNKELAECQPCVDNKVKFGHIKSFTVNVRQ